jgi:hypothetical protein
MMLVVIALVVCARYVRFGVAADSRGDIPPAHLPAGPERQWRVFPGRAPGVSGGRLGRHVWAEVAWTGPAAQSSRPGPGAGERDR